MISWCTLHSLCSFAYFWCDDIQCFGFLFYKCILSKYLLALRPIVEPITNFSLDYAEICAIHVLWWNQCYDDFLMHIAYHLVPLLFYDVMIFNVMNFFLWTYCILFWCQFWYYLILHIQKGFGPNTCCLPILLTFLFAELAIWF